MRTVNMNVPADMNKIIRTGFVSDHSKSRPE